MKEIILKKLEVEFLSEKSKRAFVFRDLKTGDEISIPKDATVQFLMDCVTEQRKKKGIVPWNCQAIHSSPATAEYAEKENCAMI